MQNSQTWSSMALLLLQDDKHRLRMGSSCYISGMVGIFIVLSYFWESERMCFLLLVLLFLLTMVGLWVKV